MVDDALKAMLFFKAPLENVKWKNPTGNQGQKCKIMTEKLENNPCQNIFKLFNKFYILFTRIFCY